jgi:hypothetical protein
MLVVCSLALAETREVESFFSDGLCNYEDAHQMDSILVSELDVKLAQTLADVIIKNQFLLSTINSLHH